MTCSSLYLERVDILLGSHKFVGEVFDLVKFCHQENVTAQQEQSRVNPAVVHTTLVIIIDASVGF